MMSNTDTSLTNDEQTVIQLEQGQLTNIKCAFFTFLFVIGAIFCSLAFISALYFFTAAIPNRVWIKYFSGSIETSSLCYLRNATSISPFSNKWTPLKQILVVKQSVAAEDYEADIPDIFCGRYTVSTTLSPKNMSREEMISALRAASPKDICIEHIDSSERFDCWFNEDDAWFTDPRTEYSSGIGPSVGTALIAVAAEISGVLCVILGGYFLYKDMKNNMPDHGVPKRPANFAVTMLVIISGQVFFVMLCILLPFSGWIMYPIGAAVGFIIFIIFIFAALLLIVWIVVGLLLFKLQFRTHKKYFRVMTLISVILLVVMSIYLIALVYPVGINGLSLMAFY